MKRVVFLAIFLLSAVANAQITIATPAEKEEKGIAPYDSLRNIEAINVMSLEGQTLFVYGGSFEKNYGFKDLFWCTEHTDNLRHPSYDLYGKKGTTTAYDAVAPKYYLIKKVTENTQNYTVEYNLLLEETTTKDTLYMYLTKSQISTTGWGSTKWVIVGF